MGALEDNGRLNEGLKRGWHTSTDLKCKMVEYEILWINSYGFNYQFKWFEKKRKFSILNRIQNFSH